MALQADKHRNFKSGSFAVPFKFPRSNTAKAGLSRSIVAKGPAN